MVYAVPICRKLLRQEMARAFSRACAKTGKRMAARMAMIAMTTSSSMSVKPPPEVRFMSYLSFFGVLPPLGRVWALFQPGRRPGGSVDTQWRVQFDVLIGLVLLGFDLMEEKVHAPAADALERLVGSGQEAVAGKPALNTVETGDGHPLRDVHAASAQRAHQA